MKNDYTHISIILDRSGSMSVIKQATIDGFNKFLSANQAVPQQCTLSFSQFDSDGYDIVFSGQIKDAKPLDAEAFQPRGFTPLYDAMGTKIVETGNFLSALSEDQRPAKVIFVVITDGQENSSKEFNHAKVREMVKTQTDVYKWQFVFLGAEFDSYDVATGLGVIGSNVMRFASNSAGTIAMYNSVADNAVKFRTNQVRGMGFTKKDFDKQKEAGIDQ